MRALYLDCFAGISGDMFVGALLDLGAGFDLERLQRELEKLGLDGYRLEAGEVQKNGVRATAFRVYLDGEKGRLADAEYVEVAEADERVHHHPHDHEHSHPNEGHFHNEEGHQSDARSLQDILNLLEGGRLSAGVKERTAAIFRRLGEAEARVHGVSPQVVHFHEVGGIDAIVDITSAAIGLEMLGIEAVYASRLQLGSGFVQSSHGLLPVPAPATAELLRGVPVFNGDVKGELVTPTGAAVLTEIASGYGPMPEMIVDAVGYGAGSRERDFPNVLRAFLGQVEPEGGYARTTRRSPRAPFPEQHHAPLESGGYHSGDAMMIEANIDDSNPQFFERLVERLLDAGALDITLIPTYMKKSRPGVMLQVLARPEGVDQLLQIIFVESTTIGVRSYPVTKHMLAREHVTVKTELGPVRVKVARLGAQADAISPAEKNLPVVNVTPEYEDCRELAIRYGVAVKEVYRMALAAYEMGKKPSSLVDSPPGMG